MGLVAAGGRDTKVIRPLSGIVAATAVALGGAMVLAQQPPAPAAYTPEQATAGGAVYRSSCASCHLPDLGGRNEAPQLAGPNFRNAWGNRPARELQDFIHKTMPPGGPLLSPADAAQVTAFILQANGLVASGARCTGRGCCGRPRARAVMTRRPPAQPLQPRRRRRAASRSLAKSNASCPSPRTCCATRRPATG